MRVPDVLDAAVEGSCLCRQWTAGEHIQSEDQHRKMWKVYLFVSPLPADFILRVKILCLLTGAVLLCYVSWY